MFDISFSELMVIAVVALVVIGPERLPKVARTVGHLLGRAQRYVNTVKADINREMQIEELKKLQAQVEESARHLERSVASGMQTAEQSLQQTVQSLEAGAAAPSGEPAAPEPAPSATPSAPEPQRTLAP
jgi:sec-independent protein translocase protein TatB